MAGKHLYIMQAHGTGNIKVGRSDNPKRRLKQLQTGCPESLRLILVLENQGHQERYYHATLFGRKVRSNGTGEWFEEGALAELPVEIYELLPIWPESDWWCT